MSRNQYGSLLRQNNSKSTWRVKKKSWILHREKKTSLLLCQPHIITGVFVLCVLYRRSNLFETRQMGNKKVDKISFECKKVCFLLFLTSITFLLLTVTYRPYLIFSTWFYLNYHICKATSILKHIFKVWKPNQKLIYIMAKLKKPFSLQSKRPKFCNWRKEKGPGTLLFSSVTKFWPFWLKWKRFLLLCHDINEFLFWLSNIKDIF